MNAVICCLNSKYVHASLAPWCLLSGVRAFSQQNHKVCVTESTVNADLFEYAKTIIDKKPDVVSFCCYIWNITKTLTLCEMIKSALDCKIILGGPEVAYRPKDLLENYPFVDFVLSGEGEKSFAMLLDTLENGSDLHSVSGLSFRAGEIVTIPEGECIGTPPSPYTDEFFENLNGRICYIETSRGCPYRCAFCLSGRCANVRYFDFMQVKRDILRLANSGTQTVKFVDRTFNANVSHANSILLFIKENYGKEIPYGVCFHFEIAGDILKDSTLEILKSMPYGAVQLEIGMQSFNEDTLISINRKTDTQKLIDNIRKLVSFNNMHIHIDLIAGLTGEDIKSFERSFDIAYSLDTNMLQLGFLKLLHGADMREYPEKYPCEFSSEPPYEVISTPDLSADEIQRLKKCEDALERLYNSGRFTRTLRFLLNNAGYTPFRLFFEFGNAVNGEKMPLADYAKAVYNYFENKCDKQKLFDSIVCDICETGIAVPKYFKIQDPVYKLAKKHFLSKGRCRVALLSDRKTVFVVYAHTKKDLRGRYSGNTYSVTDFINFTADFI